MTAEKNITFGLALLVSSALTGPCLASTYNFNYSFQALPGSGEHSISASGTLTVGPGDPISGFPILSITGSRTVDGVNMQITGLLPEFGLNSFDGNDDLLFYPDPPFIDFNGVSFTVDNPSLSDDGLGDVNVYLFDPNLGTYSEAANGVNPGDFEVSPAAADSTPEPSTTMLLICGLLGLVVGKRGSWRSWSAFAATRRGH